MLQPDVVSNFSQPLPPGLSNAAVEAQANYRALALQINSTVPQGRELALAMTNLEQSYFWALAAIQRARP